MRVVDEPADEPTLRLLHRTIADVREGMESLRFNTSIAKLTELNNHLTQAYAGTTTPRQVAEPLVLMLAPLAPHIAEELWTRLGHDESLAWHDFPVADPARLAVDEVEIPVQIGGKVRARIVGARRRRRRGRWKPRPGPSRRWPSCWTAPPCGGWWRCPAAWSTSSSADRCGGPARRRTRIRRPAAAC